MSTTSMPNFNEIHQYLVYQSSFKNYAYQNFQLIFFESSSQLTKMKMTSLNLHWKAESNSFQF